ncbi:MAG: hypothetical protein ABI844_06475 [Saprospiraceae bacterium]
MSGILGLREVNNAAYIPTTYLEIVEGFKNHTLDKSLWTHQAHLTTGLWFIMNYEAYDALCRIRSGIISYNLSVGGINTGQNGYHETITVFWWKWLSLFVNAHRENPYERMCEAFLKSKYNNRDAAFKYYTKSILISGEARARYIAPDLAEIVLD